MPSPRLHIIQSNDIHQLFKYLLADYQTKSHQIFEPFMVIVPSKVMGDWLKKQVADQTGVSTLVTAEFWGRYQWTLMQQVLQEYAKHRPREALRVPEVAVLSKNVMQWRLYGYLNAEKAMILQNPEHPLYPLLVPLIPMSSPKDRPANPAYTPKKDDLALPKWLRKKSFIEKTNPAVPQAAGLNSPQAQDFQTASDDQRLWQLASDMASMLNRYMTYRPEWLNLWAKNLPVNVKQLIADKDALSLKMAGIEPDAPATSSAETLATYTAPEWLVEHYQQLEIAQRFLWRVLFDETYQYRQAIEQQFWHALQHPDKQIATACQRTLPDQLTLFTIQQLPKTELNMMVKLTKFTPIKLLHYNPSEMFWADIVDKNWLIQQTFINPNAIYEKDHGHTLLSRFGKQSREVFAMLAEFSGNDSEHLGEVLWEDDFVAVLEPNHEDDPINKSGNKSGNQPLNKPTSQTAPLLARLQQDILMLQESKDTSKQAVENLLNQLEERKYTPTRDWQLSQIDNSLSIHACHSMVRQLEVLRAMIIGWLNYADKPYLLKGLTTTSDGALPTDVFTASDVFEATVGLKTVADSAKKRSKKSTKKPHNTAQLSIFDLLADELSDPAFATATVASATRPSFGADTLAEGQVQAPLAFQLNRANRRSLSDILVLLPDIEGQQAVIESIFPKGVGTDGYDLPAKVTGVTSKDINQLWSAITGFFTLLQPTQTSASASSSSMVGQASGQSSARFDRASVFDWLMLSPLIESYGLSHEQMSRGCELLALAGFARGFDEQHLATTLHEGDDDYRYSFAYALERLVAGLFMPKATTTEFGEYINHAHAREKILPLPQVQLADSAVIAVLCDIYRTIDRLRDVGRKTATAKNWLTAFERFIKEKFEHFMQTNALNSIWSALNAFDKNIQANQRYAHSHASKDSQATAHSLQGDPDKLPLKLGFILASIESELASQQVSAEPSGVITFGRIGAVRNLPYKLVVMLNMNLSNFPNRDKANRYDLMQAGKSERGDRFKEDDELGAFLDAILSAKEACWLFYNGSSPSDSHEHLPASPVLELINFLEHNVTWQLDTQANVAHSTNAINQYVKAWLVTHHPELPFEAAYYYTPVLDDATARSRDTPPNKKIKHDIARMKHAQKPLYPPAPLWYSVFQNIYQGIGTSPSLAKKIPLLTQSQLTAWLAHWDNLQPHTAQAVVTSVGYVNLSHVIRAVQHPAKTFITAQQLRLHQYENDTQNIEPIELDNLGKYQINANLLADVLNPMGTDDPNQREKQDPLRPSGTNLSQLVYSNILPAGVSRYTSIETQRQKIQRDTQAFCEKLQAITADALPAVAALVQQLGTKASVAEMITPCQEQRFAVTIAQLPTRTASANPAVSSQLASNGQLEQAMVWQDCIITANFPALTTNLSADLSANLTNNLTATLATSSASVPNAIQTAEVQTVRQTNAAIDSGYWINYLPTSGREKYQVQFWLNHLAWQVARHTTEAQVAVGDGFSLWQFSDKKTLYLPPIAYAQAYAWLQDWLMFWQLCKAEVAVLPPSIALAVLTELQTAATADSPQGEANPSDIYIALAKTHWKTNAYTKDDRVYEDDPRHVYWAFLLKDTNPVSHIVPFITTLGERLYLPIINTMLDI